MGKEELSAVLRAASQDNLRSYRHVRKYAYVEEG